MKITFDHSETEATNIRTFYFKPEQPVRYTAGQYTELHIPHPHPDKRGDKRWFTLSSSPENDLLSITTKYAGDDKTSSFKRALFSLKPGKVLDAADPMGDFVLPKLIQTPLIFVAGGIGVTPFHSMFQWLSDTTEERPVKFLYGVRSEDEIIFQDTFRAANVEPNVVVSEPSDSWGGERGRVTAELILGLEKPSEDTLVYVSGPEPMVQTLATDLHKSGLSKNQIVTDEFPNYDAI
jgi:ferredoxin-NADP reductase